MKNVPAHERYHEKRVAVRLGIFLHVRDHVAKIFDIKLGFPDLVGFDVGDLIGEMSELRCDALSERGGGGSAYIGFESDSPWRSYYSQPIAADWGH